MKKIAALITGLGLALYPVAAHAHYVVGYHGNDWGSVYSGHRAGLVSDQESDGNAVRIKVWLKNGNIRDFKALGGASADPTSWSVGSDVVAFWVCEADMCSTGPTP